MAMFLRWTAYLLAALLVIALTVAAWIWIASSSKLNARPVAQPEKLATPTPAQLADAPRQLRVLGCFSCHGDKLEGKPFLDEARVARLYASNLTRIAAKASDQQLAQAIRQGIGHDGRVLLVMPAESYQFLTDAEVAALIAAIRKMPKTGRDQPAVQLGPLARVGMVTGQLTPIPTLASEYRARQLAQLGPQFAAGRHLVVTNCIGCHGPDAKGREVEPGVISADLAIAGAYDAEQFRALLRAGVAPGGKKLGMMASVSQKDFKYLRDDEIAAIHAYLVERANRAP